MEGRIPEEWAKLIITIPKKGDLRDCSNHRTISLLNNMGKVLTMVLMERLKSQIEPCRKNRWDLGKTGIRYNKKIDIEADSREGEKKGNTGVPLLCRLSKGI